MKRAEQQAGLGPEQARLKSAENHRPEVTLTLTGQPASNLMICVISLVSEGPPCTNRNVGVCSETNVETNSKPIHVALATGLPRKPLIFLARPDRQPLGAAWRAVWTGA